MKYTLLRTSLTLGGPLHSSCFVGGPLRPWYLYGYHCPRLAIGRETRSLIIEQPKSAVGGIIGVIAVELILVCDHGDNKRFAESCGQK